jgi:tetratricopeptide (TPR) repeat protein
MLIKENTVNWFALITRLALFLPLTVAAQEVPNQEATNRVPTKLPPKAQRVVAPTNSPRAAIPIPDSRVLNDPDSNPVANEVTNSSLSGNTRSSRAPLNASNTIRLNYGYPDWNKQTTQIDSASLIMKEGASGRIVQIHLEETEPDSSIFTGKFSIRWQDIEKLEVEFYIPPQELLNDNAGIKKIMSMIQNQTLKRHPFLVRRAPDGFQTVDIFDKKEQAQAAMKLYQAEQQVVAAKNAANAQSKKFPSDEQISTAKLSAEIREREAAAKSLAERMRLEQIASLQAEQAKTRYLALQAAEQAARSKQAEKVAQEALVDFQAGRFPEAKSKFDKAIELDPSNNAYYFQYGVSLYKTDEYNRSLVYLNLAQGPKINPAEKQFFVGLNFFRKQEFINAAASFEKVVSYNNPNFSASAQFYKGMALMEQKKYVESQAAFQAVLDTSKDPALDERAESYIEQILRIQQFEAEKARKWQLSATIGEMYDSNVILSSDSDREAGTATDIAGLRTLFQASGRYRPVYDEKKEFAVQLDILSMYTVDKNREYVATLHDADPNVYTFTAPWTQKGLLFGKGYKLDLIPGYEGTWMSAESHKMKEILNSYTFTVQNLFVMNESWIANYNLDSRIDNSKLDSSIGDDNSSATKAKFSFNNLLFVNTEKSKIITADLGITSNMAKGKNSTYQRLDLAAGWIQPWKWDTSFNSKLSYYFLTYNQKDIKRTDNDLGLSLGLSKKLNELFVAGFTTGYTINSSTDSASKYNKWTAMLTLSSTTSF